MCSIKAQKHVKVQLFKVQMLDVLCYNFCVLPHHDLCTLSCVVGTFLKFHYLNTLIRINSMWMYYSTLAGWAVPTFQLGGYLEAACEQAACSTGYTACYCSIPLPQANLYSDVHSQWPQWTWMEGPFKRAKLLNKWLSVTELNETSTSLIWYKVLICYSMPCPEADTMKALRRTQGQWSKYLVCKW